MKIFATCLIAGLALVPHLMAQSQVNYSASPGQRSVFLSNGTTPVANGNTVLIGTFDPSFQADVGQNADDPQTLFANWHTFGSTTISTIAGQPGRFTGSSTSTDPFFGNQKIYIWIFSTTGAAAPDTTDFNNVDEYSLYSATAVNWFFSPDPPPSNLRTINSSQITQSFYGTFDSTHLVLGNFNIVPEPSALGLLSLGIPAVVLALRKRRSSR